LCVPIQNFIIRACSHLQFSTLISTSFSHYNDCVYHFTFDCRKTKAKNAPSSKINQKTRAGFAAIHLASQYGHLEVIKTLLKYGANVDELAGGAAKKVTALMVASQQGNLEIVKYLIEQAKAVVNSRDKLKRTPLTHAVMNGQGNLQVLIGKMTGGSTYC
jgi:ankyrin repeat protein